MARHAVRSRLALAAAALLFLALPRTALAQDGQVPSSQWPAGQATSGFAISVGQHPPYHRGDPIVLESRARNVSGETQYGLFGSSSGSDASLSSERRPGRSCRSSRRGYPWSRLVMSRSTDATLIWGRRFTGNSAVISFRLDRMYELNEEGAYEVTASVVHGIVGGKPVILPSSNTVEITVLPPDRWLLQMEAHATSGNVLDVTFVFEPLRDTMLRARDVSVEVAPNFDSDDKTSRPWLRIAGVGADEVALRADERSIHTIRFSLPDHYIGPLKWSEQWNDPASQSGASTQPAAGSDSGG